MVRAMLDGKKTQTRRVVNPQSLFDGKDEIVKRFPLQMGCPYGYAGERLWVKETWCLPNPTDRRTICYKASDDPVTTGEPWKSCRFMPRWASRITLEITSLRVERVQDISAKDIIAEGLVDRPHYVYMLGKCPVSAVDGVCYVDLRTLWAAAWQKINGKRKGCAWQDNPWVWAISFRRIQP